MFKKFIIVSILFTLLLPNLVLADGMVVWPDPYSDRWDYINENNQQAFINYKDGTERMILSIELEKSTDGAVWIFPVPSKPDGIDVDVITNLPKFQGEEIGIKAMSVLDMHIRDFLLSFQIYPLPYFFVKKALYNSTGAGDGLSFSGGQSIEQEMKSDVIVYKELIKKGMTTQIITAETSQGLHDYLKSKKLNIQSNSMSVFDYYINKPFSFVVSWMSDNDNKKNSKGVFVAFPTKEIYYPLVLTSVYGEKIIPTTLRILGHYNPRIPDNLKEYISTEYYLQENHYYTNIDYVPKSQTGDGWVDTSLGSIGWNESENSKKFYGITGSDNEGIGEGIKYTKIEINAPSNLFTEDLWLEISNSLPIRHKLAVFIINYFYNLRIFLLVIFSLLAGPLAGWLVLRKNWSKRDFYIFLAVGLSNCLSLLGVIISSFFVEKLKPVKTQVIENTDLKPRSVRNAIIKLIKAFFMIIGILTTTFIIIIFAISLLVNHLSGLYFLMASFLALMIFVFYSQKSKRFKFIIVYSGVYLLLIFLTITVGQIIL